jgi:predicted nucleic acid-binding protein
MIIIANSTPLVHLSAIGRLKVLKEICGEIRIPEEVYQEVVEFGSGKPGAREVKQAKWIHVESVKDKLALAALQSRLGAGESACIVLAKELPSNLLILDDRLARLEAEALGLTVTGTVGLLLRAGQKGSIDFPKTLRELVDSGFRLGAKDYEKIIELWHSRIQNIG